MPVVHRTHVRISRIAAPLARRVGDHHLGLGANIRDALPYLSLESNNLIRGTLIWNATSRARLEVLRKGIADDLEVHAVSRKGESWIEHNVMKIEFLDDFAAQLDMGDLVFADWHDELPALLAVDDNVSRLQARVPEEAVGVQVLVLHIFEGFFVGGDAFEPA